MTAMSREAGRNAGRAAFALFALALFEGCGFGIPLKQPDVVPRQAEKSTTIRRGEATRADVRAALGEPWIENEIWRVEVYRSDDKRIVLVPVLHALEVAPGSHRLRVSSSHIKGSGEATFACVQGEVLYGAIRSHAIGANWASKGRLQATVILSPTPPETRNSYSIALFRNTRWLVDGGRVADPPGAGSR